MVLTDRLPSIRKASVPLLEQHMPDSQRDTPLIPYGNFATRAAAALAPSYTLGGGITEAAPCAPGASWRGISDVDG